MAQCQFYACVFLAASRREQVQTDRQTDTKEKGERERRMKEGEREMKEGEREMEGERDEREREKWRKRDR